MRGVTARDLRAAAWAVRVRIGLRGHVEKQGLVSLAIRSAPATGLQASGVVSRVLSATHATCLVEAAVLQRYLHAQQVDRDLVIGVTAPSKGFTAHAWLEVPGGLTQVDHVEIQRLPVLWWDQ